MTSAKDWIGAARPRTLPAAICPVAVGAAVAHTTGHFCWSRAFLALGVALFMQIGTNYANDYSDGVRGTDDRRVGPTHLVAHGLASPAAVRNAALLTFGAGGALGLVLAALTSPWVILVGAASIAAGWFYTGGPRPYGYLGYGELFVFTFFGIVAVVGTTYVSSGEVPALAFVAAIPVGLCAVALLVVNNLRDIETDRVSRKRTLAVVLGAQWTRRFYVGCLLGALLSIAAVGAFRPDAGFAAIAGVLAVGPARRVLGGESGRGLVAVLGMTALFQLGLGAALTLGISL